jgi:hypothetical protein
MLFRTTSTGNTSLGSAINNKQPCRKWRPLRSLNRTRMVFPYRVAGLQSHNRRLSADGICFDLVYLSINSIYAQFFDPAQSPAKSVLLILILGSNEPKIYLKGHPDY